MPEAVQKKIAEIKVEEELTEVELAKVAGGSLPGHRKWGDLN